MEMIKENPNANKININKSIYRSMPYIVVSIFFGLLPLDFVVEMFLLKL